MISKSPKVADVVELQNGLVDYAVAGKPITPFHERETSWTMDVAKKAMDDADGKASAKDAKGVDKQALVLAAALYRDGLHCLAGRQEMLQAGLRRTIRVNGVNCLDFTTLQGGKPYA